MDAFILKHLKLPFLYFCIFIAFSIAGLLEVVEEASALTPRSISKPSDSFKLSHEEERLVRRIHAHLTLNDTPFAVQEAERALSRFPNSKLIQEAFIRTLAKEGNEKKLLQSWDFYALSFPDQSVNRALIEEMAWGIFYPPDRA